MSKLSKDYESSDDGWDDTLLIRAYDKSVKLAKEELAKRIAQSTNNKQQNKNGMSSGSECPSKDSMQNGFKVGDCVRATYDDGVDYEAEVLSIDEGNGTCLLKYIGYENEQHVNISDLVPSWGKKVRKKQFTAAKQSLDVEMPGAAGTDEHQGRKKSKVKNSPQQNNAMFGTLPPPPPMPPMLNDISDDSEHLSAMLMSWYMSGYYTGLYHGQKIAKNKPSSNNKNLL